MDLFATLLELIGLALVVLAAWFVSPVLGLIALGGARRIPAPPADPLRAIPTNDRSRLIASVTAIRDQDQWRPAAGVTRQVTAAVVAAGGAGHRVHQAAGLPAHPDRPRRG